MGVQQKKAGSNQISTAIKFTEWAIPIKTDKRSNKYEADLFLIN